MIDRLLHEGLGQRLAPCGQHLPAETAAKPTDTGEADAFDFARFAIQHDHTSIIHHLPDRLGMTGFEVVIPEQRAPESARAREIGRKQLGFLREAVIRQVAANKQDVGFARYLGEHLLHFALRMLSVVDVGGCCDAHVTKTVLDGKPDVERDRVMAASEVCGYTN